MTAPPGHESPYPAAPPPSDGPPRWFKWLWWAVARVAIFGIGAVLVFSSDATDLQITAGAGMMIAASGVALASGVAK